MRRFIASSSGRSDSREPVVDARLAQADVRPSGDHAHSYETGRHALPLGWSASVSTLQSGPETQSKPILPLRDSLSNIKITRKAK